MEEDGSDEVVPGLRPVWGSGWVGGWERELSVQELWVGGWVGGWVDGWVGD